MFYKFEITWELFRHSLNTNK